MTQASGPRSKTQDISRLDARVLRPLLLCLALAAAYPAHASTPADLTSLSLEQLLEVTVVGASKYEQKQNEVGAAVSVITRNEIQAFGWRTIDEALASLPGVYTTYDRQYVYLGTRGFSLPGDYSTRLLVTINGNRQNDPIYDSGAFGRQFPLDIDLIERIEFIPGPGGAVYGQNAMFGVINVVTRQGASVDGVELALAYQHPQSLREGRASWGKRLANGADVLVSVSAQRARGEDRVFEFPGSDTGPGVAKGLDGERDTEFFARVAHGPWSFDLVYGDHVKDDPTGAYFSDPLVPGQYQGDRYTLAQVQFQDDFLNDTLNVSGRLFAGQERYTSTLVYEGNPLSFPATGEWRGVELRLLSTAITGHKLMAGIEAQDSPRQDQAALDLVTPGNDIFMPGSGHRVGLFAQDEWRVAETLSATLGLRVDRNSVTGTKTSPRAALIWQATADSTIKALYGRAHRAPNAYERDYDDHDYQVGNPALGGERIDTLELVADHRLGRDLALRASAYQWTIQGLIQQVELPDAKVQYQSGGDVKARGLEFSADRTWDAGARLRASLALQNVRFSDGSALLNSPKVLGKVNFSTPLPWAGLRAGYELRYDSRRLSNDGSWLAGYAVSNLHLSTEALAKGLELSLHIGNLFDKRYAQPAADSAWQNALEQDGRSVRARLSYRF